MPGLRFPIGITGQGIAALAYPFIMFLPTKVGTTLSFGIGMPFRSPLHGSQTTNAHWPPQLGCNSVFQII
jgi:hypothetical protein